MLNKINRLKKFRDSLQTTAPTTSTATNDLPLPNFIAATPGLQYPRHLQPILDLFDRINRGEQVRALISAPPQHGKSQTILHALVWLLARQPNKRHAYATYAQQFSRDQSAIAQRIASRHNLPLDRNNLDRWNTPVGGGVVWTSRGGPLTGHAVDGVLIVDDLIKDRAEANSALIRRKAYDWLSGVAFTRVHPGASFVLVATRWHPDDPTGRLLEHGGYEYVKLPAVTNDQPLWPEKRPLDWLHEQKARLTASDWLALYQCEPTDAEGALVRREYLQRGEPPAHFTRITMGVDLAISTRDHADYTAVTVLGQAAEGRIWVLHSSRTRAGFHDVIAYIRSIAEQYSPSTIAIEAVQYQAAVVQELLRSTNLPVIAVRPDRDKITRFQPLQARYEQRLVWHAPKLAEYEDELLAFPTGLHDDLVDSSAYAYNALGGSTPRVRRL